MFLILKLIPLSDLKKCDIMKKKLIDPNHSCGRSYLIEVHESDRTNNG